MSALAFMPVLIFSAAAGFGFALAAAAGIAARPRASLPPPRGFRPVLIQGGKARALPQMQDAAP